MNELISELVGYGIEKGLVEEDDKIYVINRLLELFRLDSYTQMDKAIRQLSEILSDMTDYAAEHGLIPENTNVYRDLFDTKIMGILTPAPSVVRAKFTDLYVKNPKKQPISIINSVRIQIIYVRTELQEIKMESRHTVWQDRYYN